MDSLPAGPARAKFGCWNRKQSARTARAFGGVNGAIVFTSFVDNDSHLQCQPARAAFFTLAPWFTEFFQQKSDRNSKTPTARGIRSAVIPRWEGGSGEAGNVRTGVNPFE